MKSKNKTKCNKLMINGAHVHFVGTRSNTSMIYSLQLAAVWNPALIDHPPCLNQCVKNGLGVQWKSFPRLPNSVFFERLLGISLQLKLRKNVDNPNWRGLKTVSKPWSKRFQKRVSTITYRMCVHVAVFSIIIQTLLFRFWIYFFLLLFLFVRSHDRNTSSACHVLLHIRIYENVIHFNMLKRCL